MVVEAIRSVVDRSTYPDVEIIVVADTSTPSSVLDSLSEIAGERLRIIEWDKPFDFSAKCNLGAVHAHGEYLIFLNDDTEVITPDWIETLGGFLKEPDVGATGALLLFEDGRLQHAGHVHLNGGPGHLMFGWLPTNTRNRNALALDREVAGVTAACLMTRTETFFEVGGFSPQFPNNYNDVDLCLKLRAAGYRVIVSPHARLFHFESVSRDPSIAPSETAMLDRRWHQQLRRDPYYNPNHVAGLDSFSVPIVYPPMTR
jgi:GT2 family glycosyltransferase